MIGSDSTMILYDSSHLEGVKIHHRESTQRSDLR